MKKEENWINSSEKTLRRKEQDDDQEKENMF